MALCVNHVLTALCIAAVAVALLIIPAMLNMSSPPHGLHVMEAFSHSRDLQANESLAIIDAYERILLRRPTERELDAAKARMKTDPSYTVGILEHQLNLSNERQRTLKTQTNALAGELEGVLTAQQVRKHIRDVYQFKTGYPPDPSTEHFLYSKFVQVELDHSQLLALIDAIAIVPIAGHPFPET